jgi:hypothetical protein
MAATIYDGAEISKNKNGGAERWKNKKTFTGGP